MFFQSMHKCYLIWLIFVGLQIYKPQVSEDLVNRLHLNAHADKLVRTYSAGTKRKLSTAVALAGKPQILLLVSKSNIALMKNGLHWILLSCMLLWRKSGSFLISQGVIDTDMYMCLLSSAIWITLILFSSAHKNGKWNWFFSPIFFFLGAIGQAGKKKKQPQNKYNCSIPWSKYMFNWSVFFQDTPNSCSVLFIS